MREADVLIKHRLELRATTIFKLERGRPEKVENTS